MISSVPEPGSLCRIKLPLKEVARLRMLSKPSPDSEEESVGVTIRDASGAGPPETHFASGAKPHPLSEIVNRRLSSVSARAILTLEAWAWRTALFRASLRMSIRL